MISKNDKYECYKSLNKIVCHVTFKSQLTSIFKKGLTNFWFGDDEEDCYNMVTDGKNHQNDYDESDMVVIYFPKSAMDINKCNFAVDSGDGYSDEWFRTGMYFGTIKPEKLLVVECDTGKKITLKDLKKESTKQKRSHN